MDLVISDNTPDVISEAVKIALFSWAKGKDEITGKNIFGWWGESVLFGKKKRLGSLLWQIKRSPVTPETQHKIKFIVEDALKFLLEEKRIKKIDVNVELVKSGFHVKVILDTYKINLNL